MTNTILAIGLVLLAAFLVTSTLLVTLKERQGKLRRTKQTFSFPEHFIKGPLPKEITWDGLFNISEHTERPPSSCPVCSSWMIGEAWDPTDIEGESYPQVHTNKCPNGHGYYINFM